MKALGAFLADYKPTPFDWGTANCCHFAAAWVKRATGRDVMEGLPLTPSIMAARRLVRGLGGSLAAAWTRQMGAEALPATFAQAGDVVLIPLPGEDAAAVGICTGLQAVFIDEHGATVFRPMADATQAWRVTPCF